MVEIKYPIEKFKEPIVKKYGKDVSIYKQIQEEAEDASIYSCLEKYGCIDRLETDVNQIYQDVTELQAENQPYDLLGKREKVEELWNQLPIEIRQQANNDINNLGKIANDYIQAKAKAAAATVKAEPKTEEKKGE